MPRITLRASETPWPTVTPTAATIGDGDTSASCATSPQRAQRTRTGAVRRENPATVLICTCHQRGVAVEINRRIIRQQLDSNVPVQFPVGIEIDGERLRPVDRSRDADDLPLVFRASVIDSSGFASPAPSRSRADPSA